MLPSASLYFSNLRWYFNKEKTSAETETRIYFVSSIWDDDHILRLDEKNFWCLCCPKVFQGINDTKALANVLGKSGIHNKSCYVTKDKAHITRYRELQNFKYACKGVLLGY